MNNLLADLIVKHSGEILTFVATAIAALIKKKIDLTRLRKKGKLVD